MSPRESAGPLLTTHPGSPPQPSSARSPSFLQRAWSASSPSCYCMQKGWVQPSIPIPLGAWQPQLPWTPGQPSCTLALYSGNWLPHFKNKWQCPGKRGAMEKRQSFETTYGSNKARRDE